VAALSTTPVETLTRHLDSADWTDVGLIRARPMDSTEPTAGLRELSVTGSISEPQRTARGD